MIDAWNELESLRPGNMTHTEYIGRSLKRIRVFARKRKVAVWIVVHTAKMHRKDDGSYRVPSLYDCADSAHWRNKSDDGRGRSINSSTTSRSTATPRWRLGDDRG